MILTGNAEGKGIMDSIVIALNAVIPFLVYMGVGGIASKIGWADDVLWRKVNSLVFKTMFPFMMFSCIYRVDDDIQVNWLFIGTALIAVFVLVGILMVVVPRIVPGNQQRSVIVQAVFRTNLVFFAMPLAESVFGDASLVATATIIAFIVPTYNILAVIILEYFRGGSASPKTLALSLARNPLIQGFIVGFVFHFAGWKLPEPIESPVLTLASISIPMALVILGGTLHLGQIRENMRTIVSVLFIKMGILPAIMLAITMLLPLSAPERFMLVMMFAAPIASSCYVMSENMGGDGPLAGELVAFSSAISVVTLFLWVLGMSMAGLLV